MNFFLLITSFVQAQTLNFGYQVKHDDCRQIDSTEELAVIQLSIGRQFVELADHLKRTAESMQRHLDIIDEAKKDDAVEKKQQEIIEALNYTSAVLLSYASTAEDLAGKNRLDYNRPVNIFQIREFCDKDLELSESIIKATLAYEEEMIADFFNIQK